MNTRQIMQLLAVNGGFACGGQKQLLSPHPSFLTDSSLVLSSACVLVPSGTMRQVVQLLQDGTSVCAVARSFAVSPSTVSRAGRRYRETSCCTRAVRNRLHEDGTCSFAFARERQNWQHRHWRPILFTDEMLW